MGMFCEPNAWKKYKFVTQCEVSGHTYWVYAHCRGDPWVIIRKIGTIELQFSVLVGAGVVKVKAEAMSGTVTFAREYTFVEPETVRVRDVRPSAIDDMVASGLITHQTKVIIFIHPCKLCRHII